MKCSQQYEWVDCVGQSRKVRHTQRQESEACAHDSLNIVPGPEIGTDHAVPKYASQKHCMTQTRYHAQIKLPVNAHGLFMQGKTSKKLKLLGRRLVPGQVVDCMPCYPVFCLRVRMRSRSNPTAAVPTRTPTMATSSMPSRYRTTATQRSVQGTDTCQAQQMVMGLYQWL